MAKKKIEKKQKEDRGGTRTEATLNDDAKVLTALSADLAAIADSIKGKGITLEFDGATIFDRGVDLITKHIVKCEGKARLALRELQKTRG